MEYSSLVLQISIVIAICVSIAVLSGKTALRALVSNIKRTPQSQTPWGIDCAFILFLLYAVLFPALSHTIISRHIPSLEIEIASHSQTNSSLNRSSQYLSESSTTSDSLTQENNPTKKSSIATQHPMARLLIRAYGTPSFKTVLFFFFLAVVCVAPLTEEFIFRVVIQGGFEKTLLSNVNQGEIEANSQYNQRSKWKASLAVGVPALVFALLHMGTVEPSSEPISCDVLFKTTIDSLVSNMASLLVGIVILLRFFDAKFSDLGFEYIRSYSPKDILASFANFSKDFYNGVVLYLIGSPVILGVNVFAQKIFPNIIVAPIPIFLFAIWNGYIYYKTHRYAVCIGSHIALNFTSFIFLLLNVKANTFGAY